MSRRHRFYHQAFKALNKFLCRKDLLEPYGLPSAGPLAQYVTIDGRHAATITVITNDGRSIVGILRGYDQATNIVLDECHERVYSMQVCCKPLAQLLLSLAVQ